MAQCERCERPIEQDWLFCPACGKCTKVPESNAEVVMRGLLSYHERLSITQSINPGTESPVMDIYAEALRKAVQALRKMGEES